MRPPALRCAIYTRKSTEEGLEQEFNSLDAQREACEAYIKSQAGEGWQALDTPYDDGGFSGGTMKRPALKHFLVDIEEGKVDVAVVYKVDRLTRSLTDFGKIVDIFEANKVSFVSVTQAFNTTTSMGRLTLNVLLSFAQFEREVTGERIRDKIAASKKKGMWMGGNPPLGYDVRDKKLISNFEEAERVRFIFNLYLELSSVTELAHDLKKRGIKSKEWKTQKGAIKGGAPFGRGALYALLKNRTYLGQVTHNGDTYDGEHEAIIKKELWSQVQAQLSVNRRKRLGAPSKGGASLLTGLLFDDQGNPMSPTHAKKKSGRRYRYYVSQALIKGEPNAAGSLPRVPAQVIEELVTHSIKTMAGNENWDELEPGKQLKKVRSIVRRIEIRDGEAHVRLAQEEYGKESIIRIPFRIQKRGGETILSAPNGDAPLRPDRALIKALARAYSWRVTLESRKAKSVADLVKMSGYSKRYIRRLLPLAFLAPDIIHAILEGSQPLHLKLADLLDTDLPLYWPLQRKKLGVFKKQ
jgi:DNA invertase Pin-like site-specific DNA recombinase